MEHLIQFLDIGREDRDRAEKIWLLVEPRVDRILENFYVDVRRSSAAPSLSLQMVDHLKSKQKDHWRTLFGSRLDEKYFDRASFIGIKHREIGLDPKWHIAGYTKIKNEFSWIILESLRPSSENAALIATLNKYIALDMALAISSYSAELID